MWSNAEFNFNYFESIIFNLTIFISSLNFTSRKKSNHSSSKNQNEIIFQIGLMSIKLICFILYLFCKYFHFHVLDSVWMNRTKRNPFWRREKERERGKYICVFLPIKLTMCSFHHFCFYWNLWYEIYRLFVSAISFLTSYPACINKHFRVDNLRRDGSCLSSSQHSFSISSLLASRRFVFTCRCLRSKTFSFKAEYDFDFEAAVLKKVMSIR